MTGPTSGRGGLVVETGRAAMLLALAVAGACAGCDHFRVESFHGSKVLLTLSGARPTAPGRHVELWAGESRGPGDERFVRLQVSGRRFDGSPCAKGEVCPDSAYVITQAVGYSGSMLGGDFQLTDGCMIDALGNLQWSPEAQPDLPPPACNCQPAGVMPRSQASEPDLSHSAGPQGEPGVKAVMRRIHQITDGTPSPLLVLASWDDGSAKRRPGVIDDKVANPRDRLQQCCDYWCDSPFAYSGNVFQTTAPVHGSMYGTLEFQSVTPAQLLGGISLSVDYALDDVVQLWLTDTGATIAGLDPQQYDCVGHADTCRGAVLVDGKPSKVESGGRGVRHFDLVSPTPGGPSGTAVVQFRLDEDPQPF